jgi:hypothetical protein
MGDAQPFRRMTDRTVMKTDDTIFSRRELRAALGFTAIYAAVALCSQVLTPEADSSPSIRLHEPTPAAVAADAAVGVADAVPLAAPTVDTAVSTGVSR